MHSCIFPSLLHEMNNKKRESLACHRPIDRYSVAPVTTLRMSPSYAINLLETTFHVTQITNRIHDSVPRKLATELLGGYAHDKY